MKPSEIIPRFDAHLKNQDLTFEAVVVGGTALALLGVILRETRDCDILEPLLPEPVLEAAHSFARSLGQQGIILREDWLNNGPSSLASLLPGGWRDRVQLLHRGQAITLWTLGRPDLLKSKLFALCDRGTDLSDCLALQPTAKELEAAAPWLEVQDLHPGWPQHVHSTLEDLVRRLGHGI
jgi:hypothetical protein